MQAIIRCNVLIAVIILSLSFIADAQKFDGKPIRNWWLAGPDLVSKDTSAAPDMAAQERFFNEDTAIAVKLSGSKPDGDLMVNKRILKWVRYTSKSDIITFDSLFKGMDYGAVYALTEIRADSNRSGFLAVGSDDAVKVWLNGELVHKNWIIRGLNPDDDLVRLKLVKGNNQLLIKVQDMTGGSGFTARFLDRQDLNTRLVESSGTGNLDEIELLLQAGANINSSGKGFYPAVVAAKLAGRNEVIKLLLEKGAKDASPSAPETLISQLYDSLKGKAYPGIAVLVAKDGKVLYKKGFGYANIENKIPVTTTTKFRIGSITKQFTASAILKLQEQGKLELTDKLSKFFPDFPRGDEVTIHHLLTHTSGIHSFTNTDSFLVKVLKPVTNEELLNYFKNIPYDFNPGDKYMYNNSGYFLLGYIVEKLSGKSLGEFFRENFFGPLQMNNTGVYSSAGRPVNEAKGYQKEGDIYKRALDWDMSWAAGAGALYSTVEDLYKWNEAVFSGKILSEKNQRLAFTPVKLNNGNTPPGTDYGYGWEMGKFRGEEVIEHSGGLHGFLSQMARYTKENMTIVLLTNVTPAQLNLSSNRLAEFYLWPHLDKQETYSTKGVSAPTDLSAYLGRYDFGNGVMIVTAEGGNLFAQLTGQPKFQIYPSGPEEFFWKVVEARIKFIKNDKGEVISGDFHQGAAHIDAQKLKEETIVKVDPEKYKEYAGKYQFKPNTVIEVSTSNGKIYAHANNEPLLEIFPLSETEFTIKEINARIGFLRDENGKVNRISVLLAGEKTIAPRVD